MNETLQSIAQNPIVTIVSLLLGLCGVVLAVLFYLKSRRFKSLRYDVADRTIVEDLTAELDGLEVRYQQVPQQRITVSRVFVWNAGTDTMTSSDLTAADPLRIEFGGDANLLDSRIVFHTDQANQVTIGTPEFPANPEESTRLSIAFDYLDRADGVEIQLVHTGPRSHPLEVKGKIKGTQSIERLPPPREMPWTHRAAAFTEERSFGYFGGLFYLAVGAASVFGFVLNYHRWYLLLIAALSIFASSVMFYIFVRRSLPGKFKNRHE